MILFINTSDFKNLQLALISLGGAKQFTQAVAFNENYKTAAFLESFLKKHTTKPRDISKVVVCNGPGSFTGIRVGVALAQAFGFALNIPVIALPKEKVPEDLMQLNTIKASAKMTLNYGQNPNITQPKN